MTSNPKIRELIVSMGIIPESEHYDIAEQVIRECIDIAGQEDFDVMMKEGYPCSQTAKKIREHFNVRDYLQEQKPLTDEKIVDIVGNCTANSGGWFRYHAFARAIESAHDIGVNKY